MSYCENCGAENRVDARFCDSCGAAITLQRAVERRKVATLLFCDVTGSTALGEQIDSESVRDIMLEYFHEMRAAIEGHGGMVEKFIGDAVMAVFGVPTAHEDDALRAVRAAREMLDRLEALNASLEARFGKRIGVRIGVNTGEVIAGDVSLREAIVTGDAVNVAARLEQVAGQGEILLGETTYALVRAAVEADAVPPVELKGKAEPAQPYRLVRLLEESSPRRSSESPLIGRELELGTLVTVFEEVRAGGEARLALVVGEPGVGKSRLADALLTGAAAAARALSARCLPYGEGITYLPLAQLLRQAAEIGDAHDGDDARARLAELVAGDTDAVGILRPLEQVLGLADGLASQEEIAWAARRAFEAVAGDRPLVLLVDDLQWAEEPLVELLQRIAERGRSPILVLCLARPELDPGRGLIPDVHLPPLDEQDAAELAAQLFAEHGVDPLEQARLLAAAGGNPLFLEELVSFVEVGGSLLSDLPPGLEALLSARLDILPEGQRGTLERGSVEGEIFHRGAVFALAETTERPTLAEMLSQLATSGFVRSVSPSFPDESAFRFRHLLVRDAAYRSAPKRRRADLHRRFATWLEEKLGDRIVEAAEIVGYHLERAWRLNAELGPLDEQTIATGARAAELLGSAARRSLARGDATAAFQLFTRASELAATPRDRVELALERGVAAREAGEFAVAERVLVAVRDEADGSGWRALAARADVELAQLLMHTETRDTVPRLRQAGEAALATFEELADDSGQAVALSLLAQERWLSLHCSDMEQLLERALVHAERSGEERLVAGILVHLARAVLFGPRPADEAGARCEQLLARAKRVGPTTEANISMMLAVLEAAQGRDERSRELSASSSAVLEELAPGPPVGRARLYAGFAAIISGDAERAERELRGARELLERFGERGVASSVVALLARALLELGREEEAEPLARLALEWADERDVASQAYARGALARAVAARGAVDDARSEAVEAVRISAESDFLNQRGDAVLDLALVLRTCGDAVGSREAAREALAFYSAKGNVVSAERAAVYAAD